MAMDSGNSLLKAHLKLSSTRIQSLLFLPLRLFGGTKAQSSMFSGISPGIRWIFLILSAYPLRKGRISADFSSPRRFNTWSVMPSKYPSTSTGWFGSSKYEMSKEKCASSQRIPIKMFVFPALL